MKQEYFDKAYNKAKSQGYSASDSLRIADKVLGSYREKVQVKKSFTLDTTNYSTGNVLDILVGYPEADTEEVYGGDTLEYSGWKNTPSKPMTFDLNHFGFDMKEGVRNDLGKEWQNFGVKIDDWYQAEDGLRAKAYVPESELGALFLEDYQKGKYGVSIEADGYKENDVIRDWEITGGTFHTDPSYKKTKPKTN